MIPVLLHVSREARRVALEHYELAFAWKVPHMLEFGEFDDDDCSESDEDDHGEGSLDDEDSDESGGATSWKSASSSAEGSASSSSSGHSNGSKSALTATSKSKRGPKDRRVWFNFSLDALYLLGDLEPSDGYGVAAPLSYFLSRSDTWRVRRVALSFTELCIGELEADQVFVVLYHVVDRFPLAITTTTSTKTTAARTRRRSHRPLLVAARHDVDVEARRFWDDMPCCHDNVVQKVWRGWASGTTGETPRDATREIWLVKEGQLDELVRRGDDEDDDFETENAAGCEARNGLGTAPSAGC